MVSPPVSGRNNNTYCNGHVVPFSSPSGVPASPFIDTRRAALAHDYSAEEALVRNSNHFRSQVSAHLRQKCSPNRCVTNIPHPAAIVNLDRRMVYRYSSQIPQLSREKYSWPFRSFQKSTGPCSAGHAVRKVIALISALVSTRSSGCTWQIDIMPIR